MKPSLALVECYQLGSLLHCHNYKHTSLFLCVLADNPFSLAVWDQKLCRFEASLTLVQKINHVKVCGDWVVLVSG